MWADEWAGLGRSFYRGLMRGEGYTAREVPGGYVFFWEWG